MSNSAQYVLLTIIFTTTESFYSKLVTTRCYNVQIRKVNNVTEEKLKVEACRSHTFFRYRSSVFVLSFSTSFPCIICVTRKKFGMHHRKKEQIWEVIQLISLRLTSLASYYKVTSKLTTNRSADTSNRDVWTNCILTSN